MNAKQIFIRKVLAFYLLPVFLCMWIPLVHAAVTADRIMPRPFYFPGQQRMVIYIEVTGEAESVVVKETLPDGWTVNSIGSPGLLNDRIITWEIPEFSGYAKLRCIINAPEFADGDAVFSGVVNEDEIGGEQVMQFHHPTPGKQVPLNTSSYYEHWLYLPPDYSDQEGQWPLILFLHGPCMVGTELNEVMIHYDDSPLTILENKENSEIVPELFQSIVVSPLSTTMPWGVARIKNFLAEMISTYSINPNRIYLMGHAIGGDAGWEFANNYPDVLAAFYSLELNSPPSVTENMTGLPVWVCEFEGQHWINLSSVDKCVNKLTELNGKCKYTLIPTDVEPSVSDMFSNPELYRWFHQQNKQSGLSGIDYWEMY